ncbi:MAG: RDD family protein [Pleurocapsa sp. MO_226.B13]|nr:RDD family protein [Pleurocapsa sp. MO_226.B13]
MYDDDYRLYKPDYRRYPKVPIERRAGAFTIDFLSVWFISSFFATSLFIQWLVFLPTWWIMRVLIVEKNRGQSLGAWLFDIKVIDPRFNRIPDLMSLSKRELMVGVGSALAVSGLQNFSSGLAMLLLISPLAVDCSLALIDEETNLAGHDRIAQTFMVQTERGYSLDLRLKKIFGQIQRRMRK